MVYNTVFLSLRMKLDEVVKDLDYEKKVIENIKYCRRIIGKEFKVIFWNKELLESEVKDFIKICENIFENTKIILENKWISFKELFDKKNISRKECLLLPMRTVLKALKL